MSAVYFEETIPHHAVRLGTAENFVKQRRRVVKALLQGRVLEGAGLPEAALDALLEETLGDAAESATRLMRARLAGNLVPDGQPFTQSDTLLAAILAALATTLLVRQTRIGQMFRFVPDNSLPVTRDLCQGRLDCQAQRLGKHWGSEGRADKLSPCVYGFVRQDGQVVPGPAGRGIALAFELIVQSEGQAPWRAIAEQLNAAGYRRQDGAPWRDDDVRELTRIPVYAGYVADRRSDRAEGAGIWRDPNIQPLVDVATFVKAARLGRAKNAVWLPALETLASEGGSSVPAQVEPCPGIRR